MILIVPVNLMENERHPFNQKLDQVSIRAAVDGLSLSSVISTALPEIGRKSVLVALLDRDALADFGGVSAVGSWKSPTEG